MPQYEERRARCHPQEPLSSRERTWYTLNEVPPEVVGGRGGGGAAQPAAEEEDYDDDDEEDDDEEEDSDEPGLDGGVEAMDLFGDGDDDAAPPTSTPPAVPARVVPPSASAVPPPAAGASTLSPPAAAGGGAHAKSPASNKSSSGASSHYTPFSVDLARDTKGPIDYATLEPLSLFPAADAKRTVAPTEEERRDYRMSESARRQALMFALALHSPRV